MPWDDQIKEIFEKRQIALQQGGTENVKRQHTRGLLTIRERINTILDHGSFDEIGRGAGGAERDENGNMRNFSPANFVLGFGKINGRDCVIGGEDFTVRGGSPNEAGLRKSIYTEDLALEYLVPLIRLHQGGGGSVTGASRDSKPSGNPVYNPPRFRSVARTLKSIPVASAALGAVAGLPAARLVASHFSVMTRSDSQVLVAGPKVVERALGQRITKENMGGAEIHSRNGVIDNVVKDETAAFEQIKRFLSYLPRNSWELPPVCPVDDPVDRKDEFLKDVVPRDRRKVYDMRQIISSVMDANSVFEMAKDYGRGQIICLARLNGQPVGVFANDCRYYAGSMTADGSQKVKRFVQTCETFNLPIISFVDEPGFMIGIDAEKAATIRYGTDLVLSVADSKVPWASVIVRKSFGVAAIAHYGPNAYILAWPSAEMGAVPVEGGVAVAFSREIESHPTPEAYRAELEAKMANRYSAVPRAESLSIHELIDPRETRPSLCSWISRAYSLIPTIIAKKERL
ncbi:MAG: propionyl-CoA carboxylase [Rhodospirillaceae bacterium]|nr:propionyl-CoA carboxylase [Rhodospirillaceae bacterium]